MIDLATAFAFSAGSALANLGIEKENWPKTTEEQIIEWQERIDAVKQERQDEEQIEDNGIPRR